MSILILGSNGQVGEALRRALPHATALGRSQLDLTNAAAIAAALAQHNPRVLINATAYTAVDRAESEPALAEAVNATAVATLAQAMHARGGLLVHYSTDYVFAGAGTTPYREDDPTGPLGVYGASKRRGEQAIAESGVAHLIFRTSWVYGSHGNNFAKTMLRLAAERDALRVVADQIGAPTHADLIAQVTAQCLPLATTARSGIYHLVAGGETSWHGFAQHLIARAWDAGMALRCRPEAVAAIASSDYPTPAKRPQNSRLSTQKLQQTFGITLPDWQEHADRFISQQAGSHE
jgi:dTDP-4-dehydrorhamnose reductase